MAAGSPVGSCFSGCLRRWRMLIRSPRFRPNVLNEPAVLLSFVALDEHALEA